MKAFLSSLALLTLLAACTGPGAVGVNQVNALRHGGSRSSGAHPAASPKKKTVPPKEKSAGKVDENFSPRGGFR